MMGLLDDVACGPTSWLLDLLMGFICCININCININLLSVRIDPTDYLISIIGSHQNRLMRRVGCIDSSTFNVDKLLILASREHFQGCMDAHNGLHGLSLG